MTKLQSKPFEKITDTSYNNLFNYTRSKFLTRVLNSLSLTFRVGERFFCSAIRLHATQVDKDLQEEIKVFIRQEGQHSAAHHSLNLLLKDKGLDLNKCETQALARLSRLGMTPEGQLMTTKALESLTALGGWLYVLFGKFVFKDCQTSTLWKEHALEEVQHEFVAVDVYRQVYGRKPLKNTWHFLKTCVELFQQVCSNYKYLKRIEQVQLHKM